MITRKEILDRCVDKKCTIGNVMFEEIMTSTKEKPEFRARVMGFDFYLFNNSDDRDITISTIGRIGERIKQLIKATTEIYKTLEMEVETLPELVTLEVQKPQIKEVYVGLDLREQGLLEGKVEAYERLLRPFSQLNV